MNALREKNQIKLNNMKRCEIIYQSCDIVELRHTSVSPGLVLA